MCIDYRIEELISHIKSNLKQSATIEEMAKRLNVSVSYLRYLFKKEIGISISQYIKDLRLRKACVLLETTHLRVQEIQIEAGINNGTHFLKDFKQKFGTTPSEYRKIFHNTKNR